MHDEPSLRSLTGARLDAVPDAWNDDDVILYQLAVGAKDLRFVFERNLVVLPTFVAVRALSVVAQLDALPGLNLDRTRVLHSAQTIDVADDLPPRAEVEHLGTIVAVYDRATAAIVVLEVATKAGGTTLATSSFEIFIGGAGGFGGAPRPPRSGARPARDPDLEITRPTFATQALLYRLTGDKNPIHADPQFAVASGFERPILHGLCTYGIAALAATELTSAPIRSYSARFAGPVFPGEELRIALWQEPDAIHVEATVPARRVTVLKAGRIVAGLTEPAPPPPEHP